MAGKAKTVKETMDLAFRGAILSNIDTIVDVLGLDDVRDADTEVKVAEVLVVCLFDNKTKFRNPVSEFYRKLKAEEYIGLSEEEQRHMLDAARDKAKYWCEMSEARAYELAKAVVMYSDMDVIL